MNDCLSGNQTNPPDSELRFCSILISGGSVKLCHLGGNSGARDGWNFLFKPLRDCVVLLTDRCSQNSGFCKMFLSVCFLNVIAVSF